MSIRFIWLALTSISRPMVRGRSVSRLKYLISCCLPSSKMVKSSLVRFPIRPLCLSRTLKRMLTTSTSTLMVGGASCAHSSAVRRISPDARISIILIDALFGICVAMRKAILHLKKSDPVLASLISRVGAYKMQYRDPGFETLVRSIVYQQLSGRVAKVIFDRLAAAVLGGKLTPAAILKLTPARMRKCGLSKQKTAYIRDLARKTARGMVNFEALRELPDEAVIECLTEVKGIGVWTAHMCLAGPARKTARGMVNFEALRELPDEAVIECLTEVKGIGVWTAHMFLM